MQCAVVEKSGRCQGQAVYHEVCQAHQAGLNCGQSGGNLGFNLIVKNEAAVLEKCLQSVRSIADEIVVTDTGSEDGTVDIALQYADKVLFHAWQDSFSEARNFSLRFNTTEWIGWIDGDEWLISESIPLLQQHVARHRSENTIFCALLSELPDGRVSKHYLPKFFRNSTAHFEAIVHNQLVHQPPIATTEIGIWHTGYNLDSETMGRKRQRTMGLLRIQLEQNPDDPFATMNLARTLMTDGNFDESLKLAERGLKLKGADGALRQMLLYNRAMCAVHVHDLDIAEESCWQGLAQNPDNLDLVFVLGWIMCLKERFERAVMYFHRYFALRDAQSKSGFNLLILDFWDAQPQAYHFLGDCYRRLGHSERAQECYGKAIGLRPYTPMGFKSLAGQFQDDQNPSARDRALLEMVYRGIADDDIFTQLSP